MGLQHKRSCAPIIDEDIVKKLEGHINSRADGIRHEIRLFALSQQSTDNQAPVMKVFEPFNGYAPADELQYQRVETSSDTKLGKKKIGQILFKGFGL